MLHDMYETQRKKLDKLFHEHAMQQEAERAARFQFLNARYGRAFAPPSGPVFLGGVRPMLSTAPYSKHTPEQIAVLQREYAARAIQQAALELEQSHEATTRQNMQHMQRQALQESIAACEMQHVEAERQENFHRAARAEHEGSMHRAQKHLRY